jgi:hypothetical protein
MNSDCIEYVKGFIENDKEVFSNLLNTLAWVRIDKTPRMEYYCNDVNVSYTYGKNAGRRSYNVMPWSDTLLKVKGLVEKKLNTKFEVAFLNRYENSKDQLGWHADDSPEMDDDRPIAIISLGAIREIWFREMENKEDILKIKLESGSLCIMKPGMQETHYHRIPRADKEVGPRISITLRGYKRVD